MVRALVSCNIVWVTDSTSAYRAVSGTLLRFCGFPHMASEIGLYQLADARHELPTL
jgi:hypothetical protein